MFVQSLFTGLSAVYFVLMGLVSVVGTAALLKLMVVLMKNEPRYGSLTELTVEDA